MLLPVVRPELHRPPPPARGHPRRPGLGVAVVPRLGRGPLPAGVRAIRVRHTMKRHIYAVWRSDADRRPAIRAAVDALRRAGEDVAAADV